MSMGKFNTDDHYIYYFGQKSLRTNRVALIVNKSLKCSTWVQFQKWQNYVSLISRQITQHHSNPSLYPNHWCWVSIAASVKTGCVKTKKPSRTNTKKDIPFITGGWNAKLKSQEKPGITGKFGLVVKNGAGQWPTECFPGHRKHPFPTTKEMTLHMDITRLLIFFVTKNGEHYAVSKNKI